MKSKIQIIFTGVMIIMLSVSGCTSKADKSTASYSSHKILVSEETKDTKKNAESNTAANTQVKVKESIDEEFKGFLIDKHCVDGAKKPEKESKMCLQMEKCESSGYGISVKQNDNSYKFHKFDAKGHGLAKELLNKTTKENNITITVKGVIKGDNIEVSSVIENQ